jgi:hypothetical protein
MVNNMKTVSACVVSGAVSLLCHIALVIDTWMSMLHWLNVTDGEKMNYGRKPVRVKLCLGQIPYGIA